MPIDPNWTPGAAVANKPIWLGDDLPGLKSMTFKRMVDRFAVANPTFGKIDLYLMRAANNAFKR